MFNLLPEEQKKSVYSQYRLRLAALFFFFLTTGGIVVFIVLVPSFFAINLKYSAMAEQQRKLEAENPELLNIKELEAKVSDQEDKMKILESQEGLPSEIIKSILSSKVSSIKLNSIAFSRRDGSIRINLEGFSPERDTLLDFSKKIGEEKMFTEINLPVSDLAKDRDINFSITFVVDLENESRTKSRTQN